MLLRKAGYLAITIGSVLVKFDVITKLLWMWLSK
jgi:hypothetical protein